METNGKCFFILLKERLFVKLFSQNEKRVNKLSWQHFYLDLLPLFGDLMVLLKIILTFNRLLFTL